MIKLKDNSPFYVYPKSLDQIHVLSLPAKVLYIKMLDLSKASAKNNMSINGKPYITICRDKIGQMIQVSANQGDRYRKELEKIGLIVARRIGLNKSNMYIVNDLSDLQKTVNQELQNIDNQYLLKSVNNDSRDKDNYDVIKCVNPNNKTNHINTDIININSPDAINKNDLLNKIKLNCDYQKISQHNVTDSNLQNMFYIFSILEKYVLSGEDKKQFTFINASSQFERLNYDMIKSVAKKLKNKINASVAENKIQNLIIVYLYNEVDYFKKVVEDTNNKKYVLKDVFGNVLEKHIEQ